MERTKRKMTKNSTGKKLLSLLLVFAMVITVFRPVSSDDARAASKQWGGYVYLTIEKLTLGQGCIEEPVKVPVYKKETMEELVQRVYGSKLLFTETEYGPYLSGVVDNGEPEGWKTSDIPKAVTDAIDSDGNCTLGGRKLADTLGEGDYTSQGGWTTSLNNAGLATGMSGYAYGSGDNQYSDGDVIRIQYTVYGWGADTNTAWSNPLYDFPDKDRLVKVLADYTGDRTAPDNEYKAALDVFNKWDAAKAEVDTACDNLAALNKQRMTAAATAYTESAVNYIHSTFDNKVPAYNSEWGIMTLARAGYVDKELYTAYYKGIIDKLRQFDCNYFLVKEGATPKSTDSARVIIAMSAIGADVTDIAGYNLIEPLSDYDFVVKPSYIL